MTETVLVTGGTGFVAGWTIVQLLEQGYRVRATVRNTSREAALRTAISGAVEPEDRLTAVAADLTDDAGWAAAMDGVDHVLHVASPLGADNPKHPDDLIVPARDGALRVLRAASKASVKRVVMTSSCAAATSPQAGPDSLDDETRWTDENERTLAPYRRSKIISERAAWRFMEENPSSTTLTTILPAAVFGPVLTTENLGSVQVIGRMLQGRPPGVPRLGMEIVDVRDVADAHIRAIRTPEAAGERFIAAGDFRWLSEVAATLRAELGPAAAKVPTRRLPDFVLRALARFDGSMRSLTPGLGRRHEHSTAKAQRVLGWQARPADQVVVDCARSLLERGAV